MEALAEVDVEIIWRSGPVTVAWPSRSWPIKVDEIYISNLWLVGSTRVGYSKNEVDRGTERMARKEPDFGRTSHGAFHRRPDVQARRM